MNTHSKTDTLHPKARRGVNLFNQGDYHAAHEFLEEAWKETHSPERDLYQGMLQIGLAYYQARRGNQLGALKMFRRGLHNLDPLGESFLSVDLSNFRSDARKAADMIRQLSPDRLSELTPDLFKPIPELY